MTQGLAFLAGVLAVAAAGVALPERPRRRWRRTRGPAAEPLARKLACAAAAAGLGLVAGGVLPGRLGLLVAAAAPVAGFLAPDLWHRRRTRARHAAVRRSLPALLDLMRVTVEAGLGPAEAMRAVAERATGPLADEWRRVAREVELGVALPAALRDLERRLPMPEIQAFVAALERALRHGSPLGETLAAQARDARLARRRTIQEEAARAAPKIQLVVALLLVPSVMLLVAAALAAALLDGGAGPLAGR